jgi:hypothetical protein
MTVNSFGLFYLYFSSAQEFPFNLASLSLKICLLRGYYLSYHHLLYFLKRSLLTTWVCLPFSPASTSQLCMFVEWYAIGALCSASHIAPERRLE